MNHEKTPGIDGLWGKLCHHVLDRPLIDLCTSIIDSNMKMALLYPIHKSGELTDISNYRPTSLLPIANKFIEKTLANQMISFVDENELLSPNQFEFRKGRSCEQAALKFINEISEACDKGLYCVAIFCDISRAFDTVNHARLLNKLVSLCCSSEPLDLHHPLT